MGAVPGATNHHDMNLYHQTVVIITTITTLSSKPTRTNKYALLTTNKANALRVSSFLPTIYL